MLTVGFATVTDVARGGSCAVATAVPAAGSSGGGGAAILVHPETEDQVAVACVVVERKGKQLDLQLTEGLANAVNGLVAHGALQVGLLSLCPCLFLSLSLSLPLSFPPPPLPLSHTHAHTLSLPWWRRGRCRWGFG